MFFRGVTSFDKCKILLRAERKTPKTFLKNSGSKISADNLSAKSKSIVSPYFGASDLAFARV